MNGAKIISDMLGMSDGLVRRALDGLTDADMLKRPSDQDNTIGWLIWHKTRVEDIAFADASGQEQFWISDKWHEKFGMEPNPGQMGFGDSLEQVMSLECTKENLLGYADAVRARASSVLESLSPEDMDKKSPPRWARPSKSGTTSAGWPPTTSSTADKFAISGDLLPDSAGCRFRIKPDWGGAVEKAFVKGATPLSPLVRGVKAMPPDEGVEEKPP